MKTIERIGQPLGCRRGMVCAAVAALTLGAAPPPAEVEPGAPVVPVAMTEREVQYLERGLAQIKKMEGNVKDVGRQPVASAALAAAALSTLKRPDAAALRDEAVRRVTTVLAECQGKWRRNECARSQLPLQRVALQYPQVLPPDLLERLRKAVSDAVPPPGEAQIRDSWAFGDTENQRVIAMARSLVAQSVAGTPDSPAARGWGAYAVSFLTAHDRDGWYEAESPGYLALSITGLLQLADHAPQPQVRSLAARQLNLLFAEWAQQQVGGYPAGPKSRTYSFWALSDRGSPWPAWAWMAAGLGRPEEISFMDRMELPVSGYEIPASVARLLTERRRQPPYEITERRAIDMERRKNLNTALYSYATPDYILGAAQSVGGLGLRVSGGQEIVATLYAEGPEFAPVLLWSRTRDPQKEEGVEWSTQDLAVARRNVVLARLGRGADIGHAYLGRVWSRPEPAGDAVVSRYGETYVALVTAGGWEVAPAAERIPGYYSRKKKKNEPQPPGDDWVAVPKLQPAAIALVAGRQAEDGDFAAWKQKVAKARLAVAEGGEIRFTGNDGVRFDFLPGRHAAVAGKPIDPQKGPLLNGPFLASQAAGTWRFDFGDAKLRLDPITASPPAK